MRPRDLEVLVFLVNAPSPSRFRLFIVLAGEGRQRDLLRQLAARPPGALWRGGVQFVQPLGRGSPL